MVRIFKVALLALLMLLGTLLAVSGTQEGSLTVSFPHGGGSLIAYRVTDGDNVPIEAFSSCCIENPQSRETALSLAEFAVAKNLPGIRTEVDGAGQACFEDLQPGWYLVMQPEVSPGHNPVRPFLVRVPGKGSAKTKSTAFGQHPIRK